MDALPPVPGAFDDALYADSPTYHIRSQLPDGRPALLIDPGSVGNLCGDRWARSVAVAAKRAGREPSYHKRTTPLNVSGVGHGSQKCAYDCRLPVSLRQTAESAEGREGTLTIPSIEHSDLPGLLGLTTLRQNQAALGFTTLRLHFQGPGNSRIDQSLPPGTDTFQLELAPSGHLVLPCSEFSATKSTESTLTLVSQTLRLRTSHPRDQHHPAHRHM